MAPRTHVPVPAAPSPSVMLPIAAIAESPTNPRRNFGDLEELAKSIREHGVLQPVVVRPRDDSTFELVCGARRLRAAQSVGLQEIPASVRELDDMAAAEMSPHTDRAKAREYVLWALRHLEVAQQSLRLAQGCLGRVSGVAEVQARIRGAEIRCESEHQTLQRVLEASAIDLQPCQSSVVGQGEVQP